MALEFNLITTDDELKRPIISNTTELFAQVTELCAGYQNVVYTADKEKEAREDRAKLNKLKTGLQSAKKKVKELSSVPYDVFASEVDKIIAVVDEAMTNIDSQTEAFKQARVVRNLKNAHIIYLELLKSVGMTEDWLPWEKLLATRPTARTTVEGVFGNDTSWKYPADYDGSEDVQVLMDAGKKVVDLIYRFIDMIIRSQDTIKAMNHPFEADGMRVLKDTGNLQMAVNEMARLKAIDDEKKAAIEEAKREAEENARREAEEAARRAEEEKARAVAEAERKAREEAEAKAKAEAERIRQEEAEKARLEAQKIQYEKPEVLTAPPVHPDDIADTEKQIAEAGFDPFGTPVARSTESIVGINAGEQFPEIHQQAEPQTEVKREWIAFQAYMTIDEALALKEFFDSRNIEFKPV